MSARRAARCVRAAIRTSTPSCPRACRSRSRRCARSSGRAARRPAMGRWQVVVIEDADRLTEQASNALLKALEEPPPRTVFLLCVPSLHPDDVMVTIRSRCRLVTLRTPPADAVAAVLEARRRPRRRGALGGGGRAGSRRPLAPVAARRRCAGASRRGAADPRVAHVAARVPGRRRPPRPGGRGRGGGDLGRSRRRRDRGAADLARRRRHRQGHCGDRRAGRSVRSANSRSGSARGPPARSATRSTARSSTWRRSTATSCWPTAGARVAARPPGLRRRRPHRRRAGRRRRASSSAWTPSWPAARRWT